MTAEGLGVAWERLKAEVARIADIDETGIERDALLVRDLGLDSCGLVELAVVLSDDFDIELSAEDVRDVKWSTITMATVLAWVQYPPRGEAVKADGVPPGQRTCGDLRAP
jgi:acyl carrier protein